MGELSLSCVRQILPLLFSTRQRQNERGNGNLSYLDLDWAFPLVEYANQKKQKAKTYE
jgi:hypothetical protein